MVIDLNQNGVIVSRDAHVVLQLRAATLREAPANDVEFCLCELPYDAKYKYKTVVEVGWIVTAIAVEY